MKEISNLIIDILFKNPVRTIVIFLMLLVLLFKAMNNNQQVSHLKCTQNICTIEELNNNDGKGLRIKETKEFTLTGIAPFYVATKAHPVLSFLSFFGSRHSRNSSIQEYTVGYNDPNLNFGYPLFKTYTLKRNRAEEAVYYLNTATVDKTDIDFVFKQ